MPWRPTYEVWNCAAWLAAGISTTVVAFMTNLPKGPFFYMAIMSAGFAYLRGWQAHTLLNFKISLAGKAFSFISVKELTSIVKKNPKRLWLGYAWQWKPLHTQRAIEASKRDVNLFLPPDWYFKLKKIPLHDETKGLPWIHGLETKESMLNVPIASLAGHTLVFGTTGAGKTRLMEHLIYQAVMRGNVVIIIDPKGDAELQRIVQDACIAAGRPDAYAFFHPAFPNKSARIDPIKNWSRETEIPSRIAGAASTDGSDSFMQFAWRSIQAVSSGMLYIDERPTLKSVRKYVENGPDLLTEKVLKTFFVRNIPGWENLIAPLLQKAMDGKLANKMPPGTSPYLIAYLAFYKQEVPGLYTASTKQEQTDQVTVDQLRATTEHSREHYGKMILNILPLLTMLTTGELGDLLSPDASDIEDGRPILDSKKIIDGKMCVYIGLDALPDVQVSTAIGSILLADIAAAAGEIYNHGDTSAINPIELFIDEASEVINDPTIQILNKGRGAGINVTAFAQTLPDFEVRLGSSSKAEQCLGNFNNLIALRTINRRTQEYISSQFGETSVETISHGIGSSSKTEDAGMEYGGNISQSKSEQRVPLVAPDMLGKLPDLHFFAQVAGGKLYKSRVPKLC